MSEPLPHDNPAPILASVSHYTKFYGSNPAVTDLSFEVRGGEILAIVGPNGAGKTTTLRALAGIIKPTRGDLYVTGIDLNASPRQAKAQLALIPDVPALFESLTVWEHLVFAARLYRLSEWEGRAEQLLEDLALTAHRSKMGDELSRGMRQKVMVATALLHDPKLLLLDEPLTGLDPRGIRTLFGALRATAARGAAVIVSSHLLSEIDAVCDRFLILQNGKRLLLGTKDEIRAQLPALKDTASLEEIFFEATEGPGKT